RCGAVYGLLSDSLGQSLASVDNSQSQMLIRKTSALCRQEGGCLVMDVRRLRVRVTAFKKFALCAAVLVAIDASAQSLTGSYSWTGQVVSYDAKAGTVTVKVP